MGCVYDDVDRRYLAYIVLIVPMSKTFLPDSATLALAVLPACRQN